MKKVLEFFYMFRLAICLNCNQIFFYGLDGGLKYIGAHWEDSVPICPHCLNRPLLLNPGKVAGKLRGKRTPADINTVQALIRDMTRKVPNSPLRAA